MMHIREVGVGEEDVYNALQPFSMYFLTHSS